MVLSFFVLSVLLSGGDLCTCFTLFFEWEIKMTPNLLLSQVTPASVVVSSDRSVILDAQ